MRWWYSGEHSCLPSSWPGFDSRPTQRADLLLSCTVLPAGAFGGERELGAGSQPAGPAAFGVCARSRRRAQCFEGAESKTARQGRRTDRAGGRLDLQRRGVGSKGARAGGMEALGSAGAGEGRAPTLPGGLVVRIRRSHRRGPGSIPGQGSLSSSSPEACHLPRSSPATRPAF